MANLDDFVSAPLDLEDLAYYESLEETPKAYRSVSRPSEILLDWHKTENQGPIGSCQGHALTSALERIQWVTNKKKVQLSRIFAYLATQKIDGLLYADRGSTISGGAKLATMNGVCLEERTGYPPRYPSRSEVDRILSKDNYEAGAEFKALKATRISQDADETMDLIAGGAGISFGISWYSGLIPRDRIVRMYNAPSSSGGHAMFIGGYKANGNLLAANSHGDGVYEITPEAWKQMLRAKWTVAIALTGSETPTVDWYNESYFV